MCFDSWVFSFYLVTWSVSSNQRHLLQRNSRDPQSQFHRKRHEHHFVLNNWFAFNWFSGEQDGQQTKPTGWKQAYCFKQLWNSLIMTLILYFCFAVSRSVSRGRVFSFIYLSLTLVSVSHHRQNNTMSGFDQVRKTFLLFSKSCNASVWFYPRKILLPLYNILSWLQFIIIYMFCASVCW